MYTVCISSTPPKTNMKPKKGPLKKGETFTNHQFCWLHVGFGGCICMSFMSYPEKMSDFVLGEAIQVHPKDQMNRLSLRLASTKTSNEK